MIRGEESLIKSAQEEQYKHECMYSWTQDRKKRKPDELVDNFLSWQECDCADNDKV